MTLSRNSAHLRSSEIMRIFRLVIISLWISLLFSSLSLSISSSVQSFLNESDMELPHFQWPDRLAF